MGLTIAFLTILMSGVVAAVVTYRLNTTREHVFFMRKKAEELYLAVDQYDRVLSSHFLPGYSLIKGELDWNQFNDLAIKHADKSHVDASLQMMMLIQIYFPNIQPFLDKYSEQREALNSILWAHKREFKRGRDGTKFLKPFDDAMKKLILASDNLKKAIIAEARTFAVTDMLSPRSGVCTGFFTSTGNLFKRIRAGLGR
jgi:hypothetical protein